MLPKVYVETSVISYLTAWESRDVVVLGKQAATKDWWATCRDRFELFASNLVVSEAGEGDVDAAEERVNLLMTVTLLPVTAAIENLIVRLLLAKAIPSIAPEDAAHVAIAAVHGMDYLVTWNFRHINNASKREHIEQVCREAGFTAPKICTPEGLKEIENED